MNTYLKQCRWGQFLLLHGDMICEYVNLYGEWCEGEVELFGKLLPSNGIAIEVGSNIGMHSVPLSKFCKEGKVFCFEPQRVIFQVLCANIALNNRVNVVARQCAVGASLETIDIQSGDYDQPWNYGSFSLASGFNTEGNYEGPVRTERVDVIALDHDPIVNSIDRLDLMKIDAEGFESDVLSGSKAIISRFKPFLFIENNTERNFDGILKQVQDMNYTCYWYCSTRARPGNYNNAFWKIEGADMNMLCVPEGKSPPRDDLLLVHGFGDVKAKQIPLY